MTIENRVKILRSEKGITQEVLAEAVGVSRQTIVAIEKGNYIPSLLLAMQLAEYFEVTVSEAFSIHP